MPDLFRINNYYKQIETKGSYNVCGPSVPENEIHPGLQGPFAKQEKEMPSLQKILVHLCEVTIKKIKSPVVYSGCKFRYSQTYCLLPTDNAIDLAFPIPKINRLKK